MSMHGSALLLQRRLVASTVTRPRAAHVALLLQWPEELLVQPGDKVLYSLRGCTEDFAEMQERQLLRSSHVGSMLGGHCTNGTKCDGEQQVHLSHHFSTLLCCRCHAAPVQECTI